MYDTEIADCHRRIAVANSLNTLLNHNPDFKMVVVEGYLRDEVLRRGLNINADKSGSVQALKAAAAFKRYLDSVISDGEQAKVDLTALMNMTQDAH